MARKRGEGLTGNCHRRVQLGPQEPPPEDECHGSFAVARCNPGGTAGGGRSARGTQARPKLLVVEDDPNIVELLSARPAVRRFRCVRRPPMAPTAVAAARKVRPRPCRARCDAARPRWLRGHPQKCVRGGVRTPVVFLTARDSTEDKIRGLEPWGATTMSPSRSASKSSPPASGPCCAGRPWEPQTPRRPC